MGPHSQATGSVTTADNCSNRPIVVCKAKNVAMQAALKIQSTHLVIEL